MLAEPRGFCAGVEKAIKALAWMVRVFEPPVYCYHEIVHNRHVVERFQDQGVVFVDDVADVPAGSPLMLSAHGSAPEVVQAASQLRARRSANPDADLAEFGSFADGAAFHTSLCHPAMVLRACAQTMGSRWVRVAPGPPARLPKGHCLPAPARLGRLCS